MTVDEVLVVLTCLERNRLAAKRIRRAANGSWKIRACDAATWFRVCEIEVSDLLSLGRALAIMDGKPRHFVVRGTPLPGTNCNRCRRLLYEDEDGTPPTFGPCARRWLALDFDGLDVPQWDPAALARRQQAILADYALRNQPEGCPEHLRPAPFWQDEDGEPERDLAQGIVGDCDPDPIDPVHDPELCMRAAVNTLPPEFHHASRFWQLTASAGIKPGIRIRLWYWLNRAVTDAEARRWLADSPVDPSLYNPIQPHYTAAPIFDPPELDPVPQRSGFHWRPAVNVVSVPALPEPAPPRPRLPPLTGDAPDRAARYARGILANVIAAPDGQRHAALKSAAPVVFSLVELGMIEESEAWAQLIATADASGWPRRRVDRLLDWARQRAAANPVVPQGILPCQ
jgi:hypothetical protein